MCRLAYIPANTPATATELGNLFNWLTMKNGGHGTGHAILDGPRVVFTMKAVRATEREQAEEIALYTAKGYDAIWHTRRASVGRVSDALCHPFYVKGKHFEGVVAHNGTWNRGAQLAATWTAADGRPHSDSETFAHMLANKGEKAMRARGDWPDTGVWIIAGKQSRNTVRRCYHGRGNFAYCTRTFIYASDFPRWWGDRHVSRYSDGDIYEMELI